MQWLNCECFDKQVLELMEVELKAFELGYGYICEIKSIYKFWTGACSVEKSPTKHKLSPLTIF